MNVEHHAPPPDVLISSKVHFEGKLINLRVDEVEQAGVRRSMEVVIHEAASVIIARPAPEFLILVEQYRHAAGRRLWEIPAGVVERGENEQETALRELREETGYNAASIRHLWSAYSAPGFCTELLHFYLAEDLTPGEREPDEGEETMLVRTFHLDDLQAMVERGEIVDLKTLLALSWAQTKRY
jgi:ADP-ribose pyrophosphatase